MPKVLVLLLPLVVLCYGYGGGASLFGLPGAAAFLIRLEDEETTTASATRTKPPQRRQLRPRTIDPVNNISNEGFQFTGGVNAAEENDAPPPQNNITEDLRKHIVNGYTVNQATNRYPYTVLLYRNDFDRFYCGGSLIAPDIVSYD